LYGPQALRLVQKVDRNNQDVVWCFAEFSSATFAAHALKTLQVVLSMVSAMMHF
jgi:hypothetical protein